MGRLIGRFTNSGSLTGKLDNGIIYKDLEVKEHYLDGSDLVIVFSNNTSLKVDIAQYINALDKKQRIAMEEMKIYMEEGNLIFDYDDTVLDFDFSIVENDLMVDNNIDDKVYFEINNKEMEVDY